MRKVFGIFVLFFAIDLSGQSPSAITALKNEPEWQKIEAAKKQQIPGYNTGGVGVMQAVTATKAIAILEGQLEYRLRHELLYVCHGKCPQKEEELAILENIIDADGTQHRGARERNDRGDSGGARYAANEIGEYCGFINGYPQRLIRTEPERTNGMKSQHDCEFKYGLPYRVRGKRDESAVEDTHRKVWDSCTVQFYDRSKTVYNQAAYDNCMNDRDVPVQLCSQRMKAQKDPGFCPGPQPTDEDLRRLFPK